MQLTKNFKNLSKYDANIAGGKGASLGEMSNVGIPVPKGFIVLSTTFDQFIREADLIQKIEAILNTVDHKKTHTVENASEKIQALIKNAKMPVEIAKEIKKEFMSLGEKFVAIRSSATAEDGADHAWAGQLESYLNITEKNVLEKVQHCWASLFTPRAIFYRFEKGLHTTQISVAVVIQKMVNSEKSGIAFSVHPVTEDPNQLIIEAGFGLGEAIVSGQITPDSYVVKKSQVESHKVVKSKSEEAIVDINVGSQSKGLFRNSKGGNVWKDLGKYGETQVLNKKEILELSKLILKIENHYGVPQDIEWAFEKNKFYITQSRPITTLKLKMDEKHEFRKFMNRSMFLISCEIWDRGERLELPKICDNNLAFDPLFSYSPGRGITVYYNYSDPNQGFEKIIKYFNANEDYFDSIYKKLKKDDKEIKNIKELQNGNIEKLFKKTVEIWPAIAIFGIFGDERENTKGIRKTIVKKSRQWRAEYNDVLWVEEILKKQIVNKIPVKYKKWFEFLLLDEIIKNNLPSQKELQKRKSGFVYHKGQLFSGKNIFEYAEEKNIIIKEEKVDKTKKEIIGKTAFAGRVQSKACVIFEEREIKKFKKGEILVTPMTTPNFISAMKKASAFVTDEGGLTCHAAIVAREFQKPCIIGTKIATQVLHDGDFVEVDANRGVVRILESAKKKK